MGYTKHVLSGFSWQTILKFATMGATLLRIVVLARLLSPEDFGLFSLVAIALGLTEAITQTGINLTILQSKKPVEYFLDTAWVIAIIRGFLIGISMVGLGFVMSTYYDEPSLHILISLAAVVPVIKGFINPAIVTLHKNFMFFKDSLYRFSLVVIETIAAITLGLVLESVEALILGMILAAVFEVVISFLFFSARPIFSYTRSRASEIFANAKGLTISAGLSYLLENIDNVIVGRILGTHQLGLYHNGYGLGHKANYEFAKSFHHSTLPVFTKIVDDKKRLKRAFWRSQGAFLIMAVLISIPAIVFPDLVVDLVLGDQWYAVTPVLPLLVIAGWLQSATLGLYTVVMAGRTYRAMNIHLFLSILILVPSLVYLSTRLGLMGAGWALVLTRIVTLPVIIWGSWKYLNEKN